MRFLGILVACVFAVVAGIGIGTIPVVNEHLHWNIWFVVPISGAILGAVLGFAQFQIARLSGAQVGMGVAALLALATTAGYLGTDFGTYYTMSVAIEADEEFEGGEFYLRDMITFQDYMNARLSSSSINMRPGRSDSGSLELGATASTLSFGADLLGAFAGAFLMLVGAAQGAPYCGRCQRYKKRVGKSEIPLQPDTAAETVDQLQEVVQGGDYASVVSFLGDVRKREAPAELTVKITTDERVCPGCNEATLTCGVVQKQGNEWKEALELRIDSSAGNTARVSTPH